MLQLRDERTAGGLDAGADTIMEHLAREGHTLSRATIWRLLKVSGRVATQPQKGTPVHDNDATVITQATGEILAEFTLDPDKNYQRKND